MSPLHHPAKEIADAKFNADVIDARAVISFDSLSSKDDWLFGKITNFIGIGWAAIADTNILRGFDETISR